MKTGPRVEKYVLYYTHGYDATGLADWIHVGPRAMAQALNVVVGTFRQPSSMTHQDEDPPDRALRKRVQQLETELSTLRQEMNAMQALVAENIAAERAFDDELRVMMDGETTPPNGDDLSQEDYVAINRALGLPVD